MSTHVKPTSISISIVLHTAAKSSFNLSWESTYLYNFRNSYEKLYSDSNYMNCSILNVINNHLNRKSDVIIYNIKNCYDSNSKPNKIFSYKSMRISH